MRSDLLAAAKYPERWLWAGEVGEESTEEASVNVSREPWEEARDRPDMLWSESSAEDWPRELDDFARLRVAISGAL